jgi:FKBP-type peptidyl-prolyl cis-trans isomerase 2
MSTHASAGNSVASGDLVRIEYDLWAESGDRTELIDTTHESVAQEAKLNVPAGFTWGPRAHLVGGEYFPAGIENALAGLTVGAEV